MLEPGALLLRVAGQNVERKGLQRARKILEAAAAEHLAVREQEGGVVMAYVAYVCGVLSWCSGVALRPEK